MKRKELEKLILLSCAISLFTVFANFFEEPIGISLISSVLLFVAYKRIDKPIFLPRVLTALLVLFLVALLMFSVFVLKVHPGRVLGIFLLILIIGRSFTLRTFHNYVQLIVLSAIAIICGGVYNYSDIYIFLLVLYMFAAGYAVFKFHFIREIHHHLNGVNSPAPTQVAGKSFPSLSSFLKVGIATLLLASLTFITIPKKLIGIPLRGRIYGKSVAITAFTNKLNIGDIKFVLRDNTPVLRVKLESPNESYSRELYLRGGVFEGYIQSTYSWRWKSQDGLSKMTKKFYTTGLPITLNHPTKPADKRLVWTIYYKHSISNNLFTIDRPLAISSENEIELSYDPYTDTITALTRLPKGFRYKLWTEYGNVKVPPHKSMETETPITKIPKPSSTKKISKYNKAHRFRPDSLVAVPKEAKVKLSPYRTIAFEILGKLRNTDSTFVKAKAIERHLKTAYKYSLEVPYSYETDPILDFLKKYKKGYCEHFASAMVLLLQSIGIPARVVVGFKGGEYNSFGDYYIIRNRDAHTWVEVYIPNKGWVRFDPTPPTREAYLKTKTSWLLKPFWDFVDLIQFKWIESIIGGEKKSSRKKLPQKIIKTQTTKQKDIWECIKQSLKRFLSFVRGEEYQSKWARLLHWIVEILIVTVTFVLIKIVIEVYGIIIRGVKKLLAQHWEKKYGNIWQCPIEFYRKLLFQLRKHNLPRRPSETATEFANRLSANLPQIKDKMQLITNKYLLTRFGRKTLSKEEYLKMEILSKEIINIIKENQKNAKNNRTSWIIKPISRK